MIKMIVLLVGLGIGFGVGVYWGVHHPAQAQQLAAEEERRFIEAQKALLEKTKRKLDELLNRGTVGTDPTTAASANGRPGFVSGTQAGAGTRITPDPEVMALREEHERQIREADKLLKQVNGR